MSAASLVVSGIIFSLATARLTWKPVVYEALARSARREGRPLPRHLPGWHPHAVLACVLGIVLNVATGRHWPALGAGLASAGLVAAAVSLASYVRVRRAP